MRPHILLVEDHLPLRLSLSASLRQAGFEVTAVASAEEADQLMKLAPPQLVILDWMLPMRSGLSLLEGWRARSITVPVILLTARDAVQDRVSGLLSGAQDYVVKPFATPELIARARVQLRDHQTRQTQLQLTNCVVDLSHQEVRRGDTVTRLTTRETTLLIWLSQHPGRAIPRAELLREVWGYHAASITRTIDNTILRLRAKIETDPSSPVHILTVHGIGYRFEP